MSAVTVRALPLLANAALPLTFLVFPFMFLLFFPIVGIEAVVIRRRLRCTEMWPVLRATTVANLVSTILGVPLTAAICAPLLLVSGSHKRVVTALFGALDWPWDASSALVRAWAVPIADLVFLVLLVPYFLISVWSERRVMERFLPQAAEARVVLIPSIVFSRPASNFDTLPIRQAVRDANIWSYIALFGAFCVSALSFRA